MAIAILERPFRIIDGKESKWCSANNPIVYRFECSAIDTASYFVLVEVYEFGSNLLLASSTYKPVADTKRNGYAFLTLDIQTFVKPYLISEYNFDTTEFNQKDLKSTIKVYLKYYEAYSDGIIATHSDQANPLYVCNSVKQVGEKYGQNMAEYVPFPDATIKAKFLNPFKQPRYFPGYPFALSFIYSSEITGVIIQKLEEELDINKQIITLHSDPLDPSQSKSINNMRLRTPAPNVGYLRVWLETGAVNTDTYVESGFAEFGYVD